MSNGWNRSSGFALLAAVFLALAGCGKKAADYTPSPVTAEDALRRALDAWKQGLPAGTVPDTQPPVQVVDAGRKPQQTLGDYAILGEAQGVASGRKFVVELDLANPPERVKTQYIVVGIDPLWVFRQEDYELLSHWEHLMPAPSPKPTTEKTE
jgi:hypothetical protein